MALLAKKSGMVISWPKPMTRSRFLIRLAIESENIANTAEPRMTAMPTPAMRKTSKMTCTPSRIAKR